MDTDEGRPRRTGHPELTPPNVQASVQRAADSWVLIRHRDVEDEVRAAYLDGYARGLHDANYAMTLALQVAFGGTTSYGMTEPNLGGYADIERRFLRTLHLQPVHKRPVTP